MANEKQRVALVSALASAALTAAKIAVGLLSGSLALISEGLQSLVDVATTSMTWWAVRIGDKPADETHPYGHAKVESLAALAQAALLVLAGGWIVMEALGRLLAGREASAVSISAMLVAVPTVAILVDAWRVRALRRVAAQTRSDALAADALHFLSDILSSAIVLVGIGAVAIGLWWADAVAALAVAAFILWAALRLARRTVDTLLDAAPAGLAARLQTSIDAVPGVVAVERVRTRRAGATSFVDVEISVSRLKPAEAIVAIRTAITRAIHRIVPGAEVAIVANPIALEEETAGERIRIIARRLDLDVHHVTVQAIEGRPAVGLDIELDGDLPLERAHAVATRLEDAIHEELGDAIEIETHIEPLQEAGLDGRDLAESERAAIAARLAELAESVPVVGDIHSVRVRETERGLYLTFHCRAGPSRTVEEVHEAVAELEARVRAAMPRVKRILAHAEPVKG